MQTIRVWTKQHISVWQTLQQQGVYRAAGANIFRNEDAALTRDAYTWLAGHIPNQAGRPQGAEFPIWLSYSRAGTMLPTPDTVLLELEIDPAIVTRINIAKWGTILNCGYIPADPADKQRHREQLRLWGTSDERACMTPFYPELGRQIRESWIRLFDDSIQLGSPECYGTIWEVQLPWVREAIVQ